MYVTLSVVVGVVGFERTVAVRSGDWRLALGPLLAGPPLLLAALLPFPPVNVILPPLVLVFALVVLTLPARGDIRGRLLVAGAVAASTLVAFLTVTGAIKLLGGATDSLPLVGDLLTSILS